MSVDKELRIVAFLCNWCSYGGADAAGTARANQPTDIRIIRLPCSGRVNPLFILKALIEGADGVLVSGCHPKDCHYTSGNFYARRRLETLKEFIGVLGIDPRRFVYTWVSASESQRWKEVVTKFTETIHELGPAPKFADSIGKISMPTELYAPIRPLGCGENPDLAKLKEEAKALLANGHAGVIGWRNGYDGLMAAPFLATTPEEIDAFVWGPTNVQSLVGLLHKNKGQKVGIVVKGCDSRAVVALLQENLIVRENVTILAMQCNGTIDKDRVLEKVAKEINAKPIVTQVKGHGAALTITLHDGKEVEVKMEDVAQDKCRQCSMPVAAYYDQLIGNVGNPIEADTRPAAGLAFLDSLSLEDRMSFWKGQMERCQHCYACRNACPMCVCKDYCAGDSRNPHWVADDNAPESKMFFQIIHALHLAGRCTGCAECARACPMGIPVFWLKQKYGSIIKGLFDYTAGIDIEATPPLLGYQVEEANIKEHI